MTFYDIFLQKRTFTGDAMFASQAEMKKDGWMQGVAAHKGDLFIYFQFIYRWQI